MIMAPMELVQNVDILAFAVHGEPGRLMQEQVDLIGEIVQRYEIAHQADTSRHIDIRPYRDMYYIAMAAYYRHIGNAAEAERFRNNFTLEPQNGHK